MFFFVSYFTNHLFQLIPESDLLVRYKLVTSREKKQPMTASKVSSQRPSLSFVGIKNVKAERASGFEYYKELIYLIRPPKHHHEMGT